MKTKSTPPKSRKKYCSDQGRAVQAGKKGSKLHQCKRNAKGQFVKK